MVKDDVDVPDDKFGFGNLQPVFLLCQMDGVAACAKFVREESDSRSRERNLGRLFVFGGDFFQGFQNVSAVAGLALSFAYNRDALLVFNDVESFFEHQDGITGRSLGKRSGFENRFGTQFFGERKGSVAVSF